MRAVDCIVKKRDGGSLTRDELDWLIDGYTAGRIGDEQMAAWAMAVVLRGMDDRETADLTLAMARSGEQLDVHDIAPLTVDKHSTGGIGDKTSLVVAPLVAAAGMPVAKMSGRGLGFSGGTIDKLESIPGFRAELTTAEFRTVLAHSGLVIAAQSAELAPADRRLYALRDVTGTVESLPLIAASIMSKKLAAGADCIVLDVKCGSGAFMTTLADARRLAATMVAIGRHAGRRTAAVISSMAQPLGHMIGNALEVREAIATLQGHGPSDLIELCLTLGSELAVLSGRCDDHAAARALLRETLASGAAWRAFRGMVVAQGGDPAVLDDPVRLPHAPHRVALVAPRAGVIQAINGAALGHVVNRLGGGRSHKGATIDHAVGLELLVQLGDAIAAGAPLMRIHAASAASAAAEVPALLDAITIGVEPVAVPPLILELVR